MSTKKLFWDKRGTVCAKSSGYGVLKIPLPENDSAKATTEIEVHNKGDGWVTYRLSLSHCKDFELKPCPGGVLGPNERMFLEISVKSKYDDVKNCYHLHLEAINLNPEKKRQPNLDYIDTFEYKSNADVTQKRFPIRIYKEFWFIKRTKFLIAIESCSKAAKKSAATTARVGRLCQRMKHDGSRAGSFFVLLTVFGVGAAFGYLSRKY